MTTIFLKFEKMSTKLPIPTPFVVLPCGPCIRFSDFTEYANAVSKERIFVECLYPNKVFVYTNRGIDRMEINIKAQEMCNVSVRGPLFIEGPTMYRPRALRQYRKAENDEFVLFQRSASIAIHKRYSHQFDEDGNSVRAAVSPSV